MNGRLLWQQIKVISRCSSTASLMVARVMKEESCAQAAAGGHLDCLRFLFDKVKPSRETEEEAAMQAACGGHVDILKYFVEERKISDDLKLDCVGNAATYGRLDCIKYLVEEAKVPLNDWRYIAWARYSRAPRLPKLLARKRVSRTNGRRIRSICQTNERTAVEHEQSSTGKNYRTHTHIFLILTNKRERRTPQI